ncbi:hypothetical protein NL676_012321 [Syzygium grande]|nr:hypothetical protein NL676_012321 [Syzygium grande]
MESSAALWNRPWRLEKVTSAAAYPRLAHTDPAAAAPLFASSIAGDDHVCLGFVTHFLERYCGEKERDEEEEEEEEEGGEKRRDSLELGRRKSARANCAIPSQPRRQRCKGRRR